MRNTFLVFNDPTNPGAGLRVAKPQEWDQILKKNKTLPREQRRFFITDAFEDCGEIDCMYIETTQEEYNKWHSQKVESERKRKPDLAKEWSDKNLPLQPSMVGPGTHKKVIWRGSCGHEWTASVRSRVRGTGCPYCSHNIVLPGFNDLQTLHPEVAAEWSPKNLPLQPSQVTDYSNKKMWLRCDKGHQWYALISTRSYGSKCPYCSGILTFQGFNDFQTLHPELAAEWSERNGTLTPDKINDKSPKNVWWRCRACGYEWRAVVKARVKGLKCPVCADRAVLEGYNDLATTDKALLKEWPYELNADVEPTKITRNSLRPVWWRCKYGHTCENGT